MLRVGQRGYLLLSSSFGEPRWREALIIGLQKEWAQTLVRASPEKIDRLKLSSCQLGEHHYCLVEAKSSQLRLGAPEPRQELGCSAKELAPKGKELLDSDTELSEV